MRKRTAQNALNLLLSDKFTFSGQDFAALLEIVRDLQEDIGNDQQSDPESGNTEAPPS